MPAPRNSYCHRDPPARRPGPPRRRLRAEKDRHVPRRDANSMCNPPSRAFCRGGATEVARNRRCPTRNGARHPNSPRAGRRRPIISSAVTSPPALAAADINHNGGRFCNGPTIILYAIYSCHVVKLIYGAGHGPGGRNAVGQKPPLSARYQSTPTPAVHPGWRSRAPLQLRKTCDPQSAVCTRHRQGEPAHCSGH